MTIYLSLLVALVGALLYGLTDGKPSELGRVSFFAGLLAFLIQFAPHTVGALR